ncbi:MAG: AraC family transcriptional regulator [Azospirillum brasilense]|nr:MAG: AraC family transcriptional regulator [Azospirillum brasilense]
MKTSFPDAATIKAIARFCNADGFSDTPIPGLDLIRWSHTSEPIHGVYDPSVCIILQGAKTVAAGKHLVRYMPGDYLVASVNMAVTGEVTQATPEHPYLCLRLTLDTLQLSELVGTMPWQGESVQPGIFVSPLSEPLADAVTRLVQLLDRPEDIPVLAPLVKREIFYRLLQSPYAEAVRQIVLSGSQMQRIGKAIDRIKRDFAQPLRVDDLAREAHMSPSSFFAHFKQVTQLSPLQYQKNIRLQEARRLLLTEVADAASAAFQVGYESPSHFSREYARMFGASPINDMKRLRAAA